MRLSSIEISSIKENDGFITEFCKTFKKQKYKKKFKEDVAPILLKTITKHWVEMKSAKIFLWCQHHSDTKIKQINSLKGKIQKLTAFTLHWT